MGAWRGPTGLHHLASDRNWAFGSLNAKIGGVEWDGQAVTRSKRKERSGRSHKNQVQSDFTEKKI